MSNLFWLTDEQMARLRPYFPKSHGRQRVDDRRVLSGIVFVNRNGLRWCDAPKEYGPSKTLYNRWKRWSDKGIFIQMMEGLAVPEAATAAITAQAIRVLRPRMVVMLGMCAGFQGKGVKILDSIISTEAACWQDGKYEHGDDASKFDKRAKNRNCSLQVRGIIEHFVERYDESFAALSATISLEREFLDIKSAFGDAVRDAPAVKSGLLLSGSSIVADEETRKKIEADSGTALGLEMEVYGMYTAAFKSMGKQPEYFAIKTIADFADGEKKDRAQALASTISARVLMRMLELGHGADKFAMIDASPRLLEE